MDRFAVINCRRESTRKEAHTEDRAVGEALLERYAGAQRPEYAGYIIVRGTFAPQWMFDAKGVDMTAMKAELIERGYVGELIRPFSEHS